MKFIQKKPNTFPLVFSVQVSQNCHALAFAILLCVVSTLFLKTLAAQGFRVNLKRTYEKNHHERADESLPTFNENPFLWGGCTLHPQRQLSRLSRFPSHEAFLQLPSKLPPFQII